MNFNKPAMKYTLSALLLFFVLVSGAQKLSWSTPQDVNTSVNGNARPRIAVDGSGNPLLLWGDISNSAVYFSRWNGTAFTTPVKLNPSWMTIAAASWMGPDIAAKGDTVYVVMKRTPETSDTNHIYIISSFDGGQNFSAPIRVDYIGDSLSRFCTVAIDEQGHPLVAFMKFDATFMDSRWVVTRSSDYGSSFAPDVKASGWGASTEVCDCCPGALVYSGGKAAMLYRNNKSNIRDTWVGFSNDGGSSFTQGLNVDGKNWMIMSCPSTGPDGIFINDTLYSVFANAGTGKYRTYLSKYSFGNNTLNNVSNLSAEITGLGQQNYPRIAGFGKSAAIVWRQSLNAKAELAMLFSPNIQQGLPASYDTVKLLNVTNTDVAMSKDKIYVVWQDDASGTVKYSIASYSSGTGIKQAVKEQISLFPNPSGDQLSLSFPFANVSVYISNALGQEVYRNTSASHELQLDAAAWERGVYFVTVVTADGVLTAKFLMD